MNCKPTYKGKVFNSLEELKENLNPLEVIRDNLVSYFSSSNPQTNSALSQVENAQQEQPPQELNEMEQKIMEISEQYGISPEEVINTLNEKGVFKDGGTYFNSLNDDDKVRVMEIYKIKDPNSLKDVMSGKIPINSELYDIAVNDNLYLQEVNSYALENNNPIKGITVIGENIDYPKAIEADLGVDLDTTLARVDIIPKTLDKIEPDLISDTDISLVENNYNTVKNADIEDNKENNNVNDNDSGSKNRNSKREPFRLPSMNVVFPTPPQPHRLGSVEFQEVDPLKADYNQILSEANRNRAYIKDMVSGNVSPQNAAFVAQALSNLDDSTNRELGKLSQLNAANRLQTDQFNSQGRMNADLRNENMKDVYEQKAYTAQSNWEQGVNNAIMMKQEYDRLTAKDESTINAAQSTSKAYTILPDGRIKFNEGFMDNFLSVFAEQLRNKMGIKDKKEDKKEDLD